MWGTGCKGRGRWAVNIELALGRVEMEGRARETDRRGMGGRINMVGR